MLFSHFYLFSHVRFLWNIWCYWFTATLSNTLPKTGVPLYQPATILSNLAVHYSSWFHFFPFNQLFPSTWVLCPSSTINSFEWVYDTPLLSPPSTIFVLINNQTNGNWWYFSWIESAISEKVGLRNSLWWIGKFPLMHFYSFYVFHRKRSIFLSLC